MDRRRFLLGSAAGAGLLAGCTREELQQAERMAEETKTNGNAASTETNGTESETGGRTDESDHDDRRDEDVGVEETAGLVTTESDEPFDATVERITTAIEENDALTLVATVDHAANAASVGLDLPPTTLLLFGNPNLGTPLMQASRSVAIDLPQKMLVWEEEGTVFVTYNDPQYLAARHGIEDREEILDTIAGALETLATGERG